MWWGELCGPTTQSKDITRTIRVIEDINGHKVIGVVKESLTGSPLLPTVLCTM